MAEKVLTVNILNGQKSLKTIVDNYENANGKENITYNAKTIDELIEKSSEITTKEW